MYEERLVIELMRGLYQAINTMHGQVVVFTPRKLLAFAGADEFHSGRRVVKYLLALVDEGFIRVYEVRYRKNTYNPKKPKAVHYFAVAKDDSIYEMARKMTEEEFVKKMTKKTIELMQKKAKQKTTPQAIVG